MFYFLCQCISDLKCEYVLMIYWYHKKPILKKKSEKLGVLIRWIDSIQASNELSFSSIKSLYNLYSDSNLSHIYPMSIIGFRRLIHQIIDWNLNKKIHKITRRTNSRNVTSYLIYSKSTAQDDNQEIIARYIKYQNIIDEDSTTRPSNLYIPFGPISSGNKEPQRVRAVYVLPSTEHISNKF